MSWTLEEAKESLLAWREAESAVATGQSYRIGTRQLTRASLKEIAERIQFWRNEISRLESGRPRGMRVIRGVPRDL